MDTHLVMGRVKVFSSVRLCTLSKRAIAANETTIENDGRANLCFKFKRHKLQIEAAWGRCRDFPGQGLENPKINLGIPKLTSIVSTQVGYSSFVNL